MYYRITKKLKIRLTVYFQVETAIKWLLNLGKRVFNIFSRKQGSEGVKKPKKWKI